MINRMICLFFFRGYRAVVPIRELPTALVFAGINVPDHDLLFQQIAKTLSSPTPPTPIQTKAWSASTIDPTVTTLSSHVNGGDEARPTSGAKNHVVILHSKDCLNLKGVLKSMIEQFLSLNIPEAYNPLEVKEKLEQVVCPLWRRTC